MKRSGIVAAMVAVAISAGVAPAATAVGPNDGHVVFRDHCRYGLFAVKPDGTGRHILAALDGSPLDVTSNGGVVTAVASGPDPADPTTATYFAVRADGAGSATQILHSGDPAPSGWASVSPDGRRLAYIHGYWDGQTSHLELYIGDLARSASGEIVDVSNITFAIDLMTLGSPLDTAATASFTGPLDFAPDGSRLVATVRDDLWIVQLDADGHTYVPTGSYPLTRTISFSELMPEWSPAGDRIAFTGGPMKTQSGLGTGLFAADQNIYTIALANPVSRLVTTSKSKGSSGNGRTDPTWTADGSAIVFAAQALAPRQSECRANTNTDLFRIQADGLTKAVNLTNTLGTGVEASPELGY
jgi:Tol biopolymer transport system component